MARPLRVECPGALYHVIVRGNERRAVFRDDADREFYLKRLARYRERFGFRLLAFCLMDNHVHLALEAGEEPLSRIMLGVQSSYTQGFNRRHRRSGHLFQGRYKAFLVEKDRYFFALVRYIHRNPLEAGMVERAEVYPWSSDRYYRWGKGPAWVDWEKGLSYFGGGRLEGMRRYRWVMGQPEEEPYEEVRSVAQVVKGEEEFARRVFERVEVPELIRRSLRVETIARLVAESEGLDLSFLRGLSRRRDASLGRAITGYLGKRCGRIPYATTAEFFNRDGSTMTKDILRFESELSDSRSLQAKIRALSIRLGNNARIQG